jgi:hypothetical protein
MISDIENMSITLWTQRARKQNSKIVTQMDEIDKALTVFGRDRVYVKK